MEELIWIIAGGFLMSAIALVGGLTTVLSPGALDKLLLPFVAFAAGTLLGGAFFHMIPEGTAALGPLTIKRHMLNVWQILVRESTCHLHDERHGWHAQGWALFLASPGRDRAMSFAV